MSPSESKLIHTSDRQPAVQRNVFGALTAAAWMVYVYLWLPLITALVWFLGLKSVQLELYLLRHEVDSYLMLSIPVILVVVAVILLGWAEYNRIRFQGREDRRENADDVTLQEMAGGIGATEAMARQLQGVRSAVVRMSDEAIPLGLQPPASITGLGSIQRFSTAAEPTEMQPPIRPATPRQI